MDGTLRLVFQVSLRLAHAAKPRGPVSFPSYKLTCERLQGPFGPRKISTADSSHVALEGDRFCWSGAQQTDGEEPVQFSFRERTVEPAEQ